MPKTGDQIHIPLPFDQALKGLLQVKPKPGAMRKKPKRAVKKKMARKRT